MGAQYLEGILSGDYALLWVATPAGWHVRLPGKRAGPLYERMRNLLTRARAPRVQIVPHGTTWMPLETNSYTRGYSKPRTQRDPDASLPCRHCV
eukprot:5399880-Pyramimonas_sp.AAC.1